MTKKKKIIILGLVGIGIIVSAMIFSLLNKPEPKQKKETMIITDSGSGQAMNTESISSSSSQKIGPISTSENVNTIGPVSTSVMDGYLQSSSQTDSVPQNPMWMENSYHALTDYDTDLYGKTIESLNKYHTPKTDRNYIIYVIDGTSYTLNEYQDNNDFTYNVYSTDAEDASHIIEKSEDITDGDVQSFINQINKEGSVDPEADQNQSTDNDTVMWAAMQDMLDNHMAVLNTEDEEEDVSSYGINNKGKFMYEATVFAAYNLDIHANINTYTLGKENDQNIVSIAADDGSTGQMYFTVGDNDAYEFSLTSSRG